MSLLDTIDGRPVVLSVSSGKDSTATGLYLKELGIPFTCIFMDTGWEHQAVYDYLRDVLPAHLGPITWLRAEIDLSATPELEALAVHFEQRMGLEYSAMVRRIIRMQSFPSRTRRWCTKDLKLYPAKRHFQAMDADVINAVGVRAEESEIRARMPEWEDWLECDGVEQWRPIISWSLADVLAIHRRHNLQINPLYIDGDADRVGCWPCVFSNKAELLSLSRQDPERVALIRDIEAAVSELTGEERTFFQAKLPEARTVAITASRARMDLRKQIKALQAQAKQTSSRIIEDGLSAARAELARLIQLPKEHVVRTIRKEEAYPPWPIDRVMRWARSGSEVGPQVELFGAPQSQRGCVRWGMCDVGAGKQVS